jgi:archaellum component FlaC
VILKFWQYIKAAGRLVNMFDKISQEVKTLNMEVERLDDEIVRLDSSVEELSRIVISLKSGQ